MKRVEIFPKLYIFVYRLKDFAKLFNWKICGRNAAFQGHCLTQQDVDELWRMYSEVGG